MKLITALIFIVITATFAHAQTLTPKAGITSPSNSVNSFSIDMTDYSAKYTIKPIVGFTVGTAYKIVVSPGERSTISFQPELNFIRKGYKAESAVTVTNDQDIYKTTQNQNFQLNYIELPMLVSCDFGPVNARIHFDLGPSVAYCLGGAYKSESSSNVEGFNSIDRIVGNVKFGEQPETNATDYYFDNRTDVGLQFGGGVVLFKKVITDIRYGMGLNNLQKGRSSQNRIVQFTVGIPLKLK